MKETGVTEEQFHFVMDKIDATIAGVDIGRSHGIQSWQRNGKYVGCSSFIKDSGVTSWNYSLASYLYEAYLTEN